MAKSRKVIFFLGAGASLGAGARAPYGRGYMGIPTQATFWATFLRFCDDRDDGELIESFLFRYFLGYRRTPWRVRRTKRREQLESVDVEEVFTFLSERIHAPSTSSQLRRYATDVWRALVTQIGPVFSNFPANSKTRKVYSQLLRNHIRSRDSIVSFNYDTVFETSLPRNQLWAYEEIQDCTNSLRILKPHGSINWQTGEEIRVVNEPNEAVVVAPTHLKFVARNNEEMAEPLTIGYLDQTPQIQGIWNKMEREMRKAKALVFIGYSFPSADLYFSSILRTVLAKRDSPPGIVLVNPDSVAIGERIRARFWMPKIVPYFDMQQFVQTNRRNVLNQL